MTAALSQRARSHWSLTNDSNVLAGRCAPPAAPRVRTSVSYSLISCFIYRFQLISQRMWIIQHLSSALVSGANLPAGIFCTSLNTTGHILVCLCPCPCVGVREGGREGGEHLLEALFSSALKTFLKMGFWSSALMPIIVRSIHTCRRPNRSGTSANSTGERVHMLECACPPQPESLGLTDGKAGLPYMHNCATSVNLDSGPVCWRCQGSLRQCRVQMLHLLLDLLRTVSCWSKNTSCDFVFNCI